MARKRMVTRTIMQTTAEVKINKYDIGGEYTDSELLTKLQEIFQTDTFKLVHIENQSCKELLLGMDEDEFIRLAKVLPPRGTKVESDKEE